jgi:hypothetical protein
MKLKSYVAVSESGVLYNASSGDSFSINPVAVSIINMLKAGQEEKEIKAHLLDKYDVDSERLDADYYDFIAHLRQLNLLEKDGA